jgi:hypothetical protein
MPEDVACHGLSQQRRNGNHEKIMKKSNEKIKLPIWQSKAKIKSNG